jgi:hypothetical protein
MRRHGQGGARILTLRGAQVIMDTEILSWRSAAWPGRSVSLGARRARRHGHGVARVLVLRGVRRHDHDGVRVLVLRGMCVVMATVEFAS